ncbi:MAG: adenylosuccinate synthetase, partial [Clostridia bacterium]|nr:adenylosuccinate synthetase [Clostridia bacterium]
IAPFYSDKFAKIGFQVNELFDDEEGLREKIAGILEVKNAILQNLYHKDPISVEDIFNKLMEYKTAIVPYVGDAFTFVHEAVKSGKTILLEGQLGSLKDTDFGIYPMVTSSNTIAGYGAVGAGIPPYEIKDIITVVKAYSSAVGAGEFVSEIFGEEADLMRNHGGDGGEYGATTGRPRRMGWLDLVATRYGCQVQGTTEVAFTVLDALGYLDEIPVCVAYELDGKQIDYFPTTTKLKRCKPVLKVMKGWKCDISGITEYDKLPKECRDYVEFAEQQIGFPITMVSNGPKRENLIYRK